MVNETVDDADDPAPKGKASTAPGSSTSSASTTYPPTTLQPISTLTSSTSGSKQSDLKDFLVPKKTSPTYKRKADDALLNLFTNDFQPFSIVNDWGFRKFVNVLNPSYELPSRVTIS